MHETFGDALERGVGGVHEERYAFAGRPVRLRVLGTGLGERTHRAFAHLRDRARPPAAAGLRIDLWDETETGVAGVDAASAELDREWMACGGALTASADGRYVGFRYRDSVTLLDRHGQHLVGCRRNGSHLSGGEYSKPLQLMLSIWYHDQGVQTLHAGLVAHDEAGVLLPGASGTGKSTTAVAAAVHGLEFLGDDFVGIERSGENGFVGHSMYGTSCVARENLHRFPGLRAQAVEERLPEEEKPILFLSEIYPQRVRRSVPVRAVALLRVGYTQTRISPARPAEALREFAAGSLHTVVPRPGREALQLLAELVARVPAYWLFLSPDLGDGSRALERVLSRDEAHVG